MRRLIGIATTAVLCGILLAACSQTGSPKALPTLAGAYGDLAAYWKQVAASLGIDPGDGLVQEWTLSYGDGGSVSESRLVLYVNRGSNKYDVYTIIQNRTGEAKWDRSKLDDPATVIAVPAQALFTQLNAVGFRRLESQQAISPPIRFWFYTVSGAATYGPQTHTQLIKDGRITPVGPGGVTLRGTHGTFVFTREADTTRESALPLYLMPEVGCAPESPDTYLC